MFLDITMRKNILPYAPAERMLKQAGAKRISQESKVALMESLEDYAKLLIIKALQVMKNCNRKTILGEDLKISQ